MFVGSTGSEAPCRPNWPDSITLAKEQNDDVARERSPAEYAAFLIERRAWQDSAKVKAFDRAVAAWCRTQKAQYIPRPLLHDDVAHVRSGLLGNVCFFMSAVSIVTSVWRAYFAQIRESLGKLSREANASEASFDLLVAMCERSEVIAVARASALRGEDIVRGHAYNTSTAVLHDALFRSSLQHKDSLYSASCQRRDRLDLCLMFGKTADVVESTRSIARLILACCSLLTSLGIKLPDEPSGLRAFAYREDDVPESLVESAAAAPVLGRSLDGDIFRVHAVEEEGVPIGFVKSTVSRATPGGLEPSAMVCRNFKGDHYWFAERLGKSTRFLVCNDGVCHVVNMAQLVPVFAVPLLIGVLPVIATPDETVDGAGTADGVTGVASLAPLASMCGEHRLVGGSTRKQTIARPCAVLATSAMAVADISCPLHAGTIEGVACESVLVRRMDS